MNRNGSVLTVMQRPFEYLSLALYCATAIVLIGLNLQMAGLVLLALGAVSLLGCTPEFRRGMLLVYACLLVLYVMPITTSTALPQAAYMGLGLATVVLLPYFVTNRVYQDGLIRFPSLRDKSWNKRRTGYLLFVAALCYLLLPFMLRDTNSYPNWNFPPDFWGSLQAYIGLNTVGIWDELFFVCTVLAILRAHFPFAVANVAQAVLFTSFLYVLAFKGWCVPVIFLFALLQGYVFRQTKSLLFILAIHLTVDLILHFAIFYLHYPHLFPYFVT